MPTRGHSTRQRCVVFTLAAAMAFATIATGAGAHDPGLHPKDHRAAGLGMQVNSPAELVDFHPGVQWGDTGAVDSQTAQLVYAGTGCTPASYAPVSDRIQGNIALVDDRVSETDPNDQCPRYTFAQKVQSAERAGAIGFVQIPREGSTPRGNATAITAEIPAVELERTGQVVAVRDAVIRGTAVEAMLTPPPSFDHMTDRPCENGKAGPFECDGVDLLAFIPADEFNGAGQSDLWGWTDPETGDEYVLLGKTNGVAFFRVTDPTDPVYLGELPNPAALHQIWHDMKVYDNHAFIVSESEPHGMTVFDLTRLRGVTEPRQWDQDAFYRLHSAAHNIAINTETGFAYIVGGNTGLLAPDQCLSGLHMVDISTPKEPTFAGCYLEEGGPGTAARTIGGPAKDLSPAAYVHDAECVIYRGPDERYTGREICFNAAENKLVIADVTNKLVPVTLGFTDYPGVSYAHQGSLTADHRFVLLNDELDETTNKTNTRTIVMDVSDLENPKVHFEHLHDTQSIDHNNYVHDGRVYQSNYTSGLRILDTTFIDDADNPRLEPFAFFDTYPAHSDPTFDGTWSNYPFFESGTIAVSGIDEGLFLLRLGAQAPDDDPPTVVSVTPADGATGVAVGTNVSATFSEAMQGSSIGASSFRLTQQGSSTELAARVSYDADTKTATLDPDAALEHSTTYLATVKGGGGGVRDEAGDPLAGDEQWRFTTAQAPARQQPPSRAVGGQQSLPPPAGDNSGRAGAGVPSTRSYRSYCKRLSRKRIRGQRGTPASRCIKGMKKLATGKVSSPRAACRKLSAKRRRGQKRSDRKLCVQAGRRLLADRRKAPSATSTADPAVSDSEEIEVR